MKKNGDTVSYTREELEELRRREGTRTDWARVNATTQEELEAAIAIDPDEADMVIDWNSVTTVLPKAPVSIRLDPDVLEFFRSGGKGYQTSINAVLRTYMEQVRKKAG